MQTEQRPMGSRLQQERLSSPDFVRLQEIAQGLKTDNHRRFLEDILACLRDQDDPIAALELLKALVGEAANQRPEPRLALGQVGQFFEQRLRREPGVTVERLQLELTWLKRLIVGLKAEEQLGPGAGARGAGGGGGAFRSETAVPSFGNSLAQLKRERERVLTEQKTGALGRATEQGATPPTSPAEGVQWQLAMLTRSKGDGMLVAQLSGGKKAEARRPRAELLWNGLPAELKGRIDKGKAVQVKVRVSPLGNALQLDAIEPVG